MPNDYHAKSRAFYTERLQSMKDNPGLLPQVAEQEAGEGPIGVGLNSPNEVSVFERLDRAAAEREGRPEVDLTHPFGVNVRRPGSHPVYKDDEEPIPVEESHHISFMTRTKKARPAATHRGEEGPVIEAPPNARVPAVSELHKKATDADLKNLTEGKTREPKLPERRPARSDVPDPVHPQARRPAGGN